MMEELWQLKPIGHMKSVFHFKNGTPRQPAVCSHARGSVTIDKSIFNNPEHSLEGLGQFSHVWVMFLFHKNNNSHTKAKVKPPRLDGKRVGVFSTRSPYRPNPIGLTLAAIDRIEGATVYLKGVDILDGTPILDIKPFIPEYDAPQKHLSTQQDTATVEGMSPSHIDTDCDHLCQDSNRLTNTDLRCDSSNKAQACSKADTEYRDVSCVERVCQAFDDSSVCKETDTDVCKEETTNSAGNELINEVSGDSRREATPACIPAPACSKTPDTERNVSERSLNKNASADIVKTADWVSHSTVKKLDVRFTPTAAEQLKMFSTDRNGSDYKLHLFSSVCEVEAAIQQVLNEDPRSVYRRNKCKDSLYFFAIDSVHVTCWFDEAAAEVVRIQPVSRVPQCL